MSDEELDALFQRGAAAYPSEVNLSAWLLLEQKLEVQARRRLARRAVLRFFALEVAIVALLAGLWYARSIEWGGELTKPAVVAARPGATPNSPQPAARRRTLPHQATAARQNAGVATEVGGANAAPSSATTLDQQAEALLTDAPQPASAGASASGAAPGTSRLNPVVGAVGTTRSSTVVGPPDEKQPTAEARVTTAAALTTPEAAPAKPKAAVQPHLGLVAAAVTSRARVRAKPRQTRSVGEGAGATSPAAGAAPSAAPAASPRPRTGKGRTARPATGAVAPVGPELLPYLTPQPASITGPTVAALPHPLALLPVADSVVVPTPPKPAMAGPAYRLGVRLLVAPEMTIVHMDQWRTPGYTTGLLVEYNLTPRLRIRTGLTYSLKRYAALGSDYNPPPNYWTWRATVNKVYGVCQVFEMPIDLRYDVLVRPNGLGFVSLGIGAMRTRREQYTYLYSSKGYYSTTNGRYDWETYGKGQMVLRSLTVAAGYEALLSPRWAVQAEPFMKLPLGGVGFGKIKLNSVGFNVSARFGLLRAQGGRRALRP